MDFKTVEISVTGKKEALAQAMCHLGSIFHVFGAKITSPLTGWKQHGVEYKSAIIAVEPILAGGFLTAIRSFNRFEGVAVAAVLGD